MGQMMYGLICSNCRDQRSVAQCVLANRQPDELRCSCGGLFQVVPEHVTKDPMDAYTVTTCPNCHAKLSPDELQDDFEDEDVYYCIHCQTEIPLECLILDGKDSHVEEFWNTDKREEEEDD